MAVQPYLFFEGRCDEAIEFYRKALGAEVRMLMRFKDAPPAPPQENCPPPPDPNKVMHAEIQIGGAGVLMSDGHASGKPEFKGFGLSYTVASEADASRYFNALREGGQ